jgi:hypothetical protein
MSMKTSQPMHALYVLEDVMCRVRALDPDNEHFQSECWEIAARIIGQRANDFGPLHKDSVLLLMESLLAWEASHARAEDRQPSFADIVQRLRGALRLRNPDAPDLASADIFKTIPPFPRLEVLEAVLKHWLDEGHDIVSVMVLGAMEGLLKEASAYIGHSPMELKLHERAKHWRNRETPLSGFFTQSSRFKHRK